MSKIRRQLGDRKISASFDFDSVDLAGSDPVAVAAPQRISKQYALVATNLTHDMQCMFAASNLAPENDSVCGVGLRRGQR